MFDKTIQIALHAVAASVVVLAAAAGLAQFVPQTTEPAQFTQLERVVVTAKAARS